MDYQCVFCILRSFENLLKKHPVRESEKKDIVRDFIQYFSTLDINLPTPEIAREIHKKFKTYLNDNDPYRKEKRVSNQIALELYPDLKNKIINSKNQFNTALRLAIAGNIIDYGPGHDFDIKKTIDYVLNSDIKIDHSKKLFEKIKQSKQILYLGDNAGEIVFDKLFIETISHPNIFYAVRGKPVINDVTIEDAKYVGIDKITNVISNGYDAPSTILNKVSDEFMSIYNSSDLIISKGQGNLEGLLNNKRKDLFFLLMIKCDLIGKKLNVKKGDFVVMQNCIRYN
ncbi:MAG: DUF89 family protein [Bacteroidales bacterium]|nr:DUF89 family protein [Bacteroidales bacterium]